MIRYIRYIVLMALCVASLQSQAVEAQRDTVFFYKTWSQMLNMAPEAMLENPIVEYYSPYHVAIYTIDEELNKSIAEDYLAASLGDSIWLLSSDFLKKRFTGDVKRFYDFVPVFFNEKVAFITYGDASSFLDFLFGPSVVDGEIVLTPCFFYLDFLNNKITKVNHTVLSALLEDYHDLQVRYEGMKDYKKPYMIEEFFYKYVDRATQDIMRPRILDLTD